MAIRTKFISTRIEAVTGFYEHGNESSITIRGGEFIDKFLKKQASSKFY